MTGLMYTVQQVLENEVVEKCNSCSYYVSCSYRLSSGKFILQCEEYKNAGTEVESENNNISPAGLCSNCSKMSHCKLPKSPAGVWHCEEYE